MPLLPAVFQEVEVYVGGCLPQALEQARENSAELQEAYRRACDSKQLMGPVASRKLRQELEKGQVCSRSCVTLSTCFWLRHTVRVERIFLV